MQIICGKSLSDGNIVHTFGPVQSTGIKFYMLKQMNSNFAHEHFRADRQANVLLLASVVWLWNMRRGFHKIWTVSTRQMIQLKLRRKVEIIPSHMFSYLKWGKQTLLFLSLLSNKIAVKRWDNFPFNLINTFIGEW